MIDPQQILAEANRHFDADELDAAERLYRQLLALEPANSGLLRILGVIARKRGQMEEALRLLHAAAKADPGQHLNDFELGTTLVKLERFEEALPHFLRAVEKAPHFQPAVINMGAVLERLERIEEALPWCERALELNPNCHISHYNLGNVLRELGRFTEADRHFVRSIELCPDSAKAHWNRAYCHLVQGRFREGWEEYEWREAAGEVSIDRYTQARWDGSPLTGKTLLVHGEQGLGDEILFASCVPDVIRQAARVILVCDPRLRPLFQRSFPQAVVYGWQRLKDWTPAPITEQVDWQIPSGSLPLYLRPTAESFPQRERYLVPDPQQVEHWRRRLVALGPGLAVGISWQAGGQPVERRKRSMSLAQWQRLCRVPGTKIISLQYGERHDELEAARRELGLTIHQFEDCDPLIDLDNFAALIAALDLVISVGNATVHLAGAVGAEAWTLLPLVPSWRWLSATEYSPWYSSVRLFRQPRRGAWEPVLEQVTQLLYQRAVGSSENFFVHTDHGPPSGAEVPIGTTVALPSPVKPPEQAAFSRVARSGEVLEQAVQLFRAGRLAEAERLAREILDHTPRNFDALHLLGTVARAQGKFDLAIRSLRRALAISPQEPILLCELAAAQAAQGELAAAVHSYLNALEMTPDSPEILLSLGKHLWQMGHAAEALRCYHTALAFRPDYAKAHNALGVAQLEAGMYPEATASFLRALSSEPTYFAAHNNLGRALELAGYSEEALLAYRRALAISPDCEPARCNLVKLLCRLGRSQEAEELVRHAQPARRAQAPHAAPSPVPLGITAARQQGGTAGASSSGNLAGTLSLPPMVAALGPMASNVAAPIVPAARGDGSAPSPLGDPSRASSATGPHAAPHFGLPGVPLAGSPSQGANP
jgi:tetratricopeptide (TPR) repeat protein